MSHKSRSPGNMAEASGPPGQFVTDDTRTPGTSARNLEAPSWLSGWPDDGSWVDRWLSPARLATYLTATAGNREAALRLYEWNAQVGAALIHDLGRVEIGLRNAYDIALDGIAAPSGHWVYSADTTLFPPMLRSRSGVRVDVNMKPRRQVADAIAAAGGPSAQPGKIIAELGFGFWRYLSSARHEKTLWVPYLHRVFPPGTDRRAVDRRVGRQHEVRNRAAHHEPLFRIDLYQFLSRDVLGLAELVDPALAVYISATSALPELLHINPDGFSASPPAPAVTGRPLQRPSSGLAWNL